ncbi:MAG: Hpt domain-containing protein [Rhodocyclaceae bacterium]|nr:Hpt domain-containing protein [Rhodocyclaceae bacterium]
MSERTAAMQQKLAKLKANYLAELPERLDELEQLALQLGQAEPAPQALGELCRKTHSLKGSAGSYGLAIITDICHQMEDILSACPTDATRLAAEQVDGCLVHIDLMRKAQVEAAAGADTFAELERALEALRGRLPGKRLTGLLVETSKVNTLLYLNALRALPIEFTVVDNGYVALGQVLQQKFDLLISGQLLPVLNGTALIAAVRLSGSDNRCIPAILVSAAPLQPLPAALAPDQVLTRDAGIGDALLHSVRDLLRARGQENP